MPESVDSRIAALQAELAQLRADMQEFTATVSHDLRAPLRHIVSYVQLVEEDAGPLLTAEVREFLATITHASRQMGKQLDGLTLLSRAGSAALVVAPVALQEPVQAARDAVSVKYRDRAVEWRIEPDLPTVLADAAMLQQVLEQVLDNALKFSTARTPAEIRISAALSSDERCISLQVNDNGVGFNASRKSALFKVFGRLHSERQFEGVGVGLVLSHKLMQRMGGSISIDAVQDVGCSVTLVLPRELS